MKQEYDFTKGMRGRILPVPRRKTRITIRIDDDLVEWLHRRVDERGRGNYQTMINQAVREYVNREEEGVRPRSKK